MTDPNPSHETPVPPRSSGGVENAPGSQPRPGGLPLPFSELLPIGKWLEVLRLPLLRWVLLFALLPLALGLYSSGYLEPAVAARIVGLYFAVLWGYVLMQLLGFFQVKARNLLVPALFTPIVGIFLVLLIQQFPGLNLLYGATNVSFDPLRLIGFVFGVGLLEETVKILPILWLCYSAKEIFTPREAAFYAGVSGLAFGVAESARYIESFSSNADIAASGNYIIWQFLRLITLPLLHAAFSGLVGYYVGLGIAKPRSRRALVIFGIGVSALVHGLYDFAGGWLSLIIAAFALVSFVGAARSDAARVG